VVSKCRFESIRRARGVCVMAPLPRSSDGSAGTEPSRKRVAAEKAESTFHILPRLEQPPHSRGWFTSLLHYVRHSRRHKERVLPGIYPALLRALEQFVKHERPGGRWTAADRHLAIWLLSKSLSEHRCPLPGRSLPGLARRNYGKTTALPPLGGAVCGASQSASARPSGRR
jgi:hypothetical protein